MKMISKFQLSIICLIAFIAIGVQQTVMAQSDDAALLKGSRAVYHELSFGGTAATSGILQTFDKEIKPYFNVGGGFQINYTIHFNQSVSLVFGAAAKYCQNTYGFDLLGENSNPKWNPVTSIEENFLFNANIRDYIEKYNALHVQIPLLFGYEVGSPLAKWYINMGGAAQFTIYGKYNTEISYLKTEGDIPTYGGGLTYPSDLRDLGIGEEYNIKVDGKPSLKFTVNGYLETGIKFSIGKSSWLYVGAFGEMSALKNSISGTEGSGSENIINFAPKQRSNELMDNLNVTSITNTKHTSGGRTYAFGGVVRIGFDFHTSKRMLSSVLR
jgi:hypothetical protein